MKIGTNKSIFYLFMYYSVEDVTIWENNIFESSIEKYSARKMYTLLRFINSKVYSFYSCKKLLFSLCLKVETILLI